jgi:hypothetical protein
MLLKPRGYLLISANSGASKTLDLVVGESTSFDEDCEDVVGVGTIGVDSEVSEVIA